VGVDLFMAELVEDFPKRCDELLIQPTVDVIEETLKIRRKNELFQIIFGETVKRRNFPDFRKILGDIYVSNKKRRKEKEKELRFKVNFVHCLKEKFLELKLWEI